MLFKAAEPVESHGKGAEDLTGLEAVGGTLEGDGTVGALPVAITEEGDEPEKEIQQIKGNYQ
jgi:hypothetical protein